jgi:hypothetical protein
MELLSYLYFIYINIYNNNCVELLPSCFVSKNLMDKIYKITILLMSDWGVAPCNLIHVHRRFVGT